MTSDSYFTLTFYARKPKTDKSEYPLYARISVGGQMTEFTIGRSVNPKHWNQKRNVSDGTSRRDKELNKFLEMVRAFSNMSVVQCHKAIFFLMRIIAV